LIQLDLANNVTVQKERGAIVEAFFLFLKANGTIPLFLLIGVANDMAAVIIVRRK